MHLRQSRLFKKQIKKNIFTVLQNISWCVYQHEPQQLIQADRDNAPTQKPEWRTCREPSWFYAAVRSDSPVCAETAAHCPPRGERRYCCGPKGWIDTKNCKVWPGIWTGLKKFWADKETRAVSCANWLFTIACTIPPTDEKLCSSLFVLQKLDGTTLNNITKWNLSNALVIHGSLREHQASVLKTAILFWYLETILVVSAKLNTH